MGSEMCIRDRKQALPDFKASEEDDEVTKLTGGAEPASNLNTRHITPQICVDSGATSRTLSRVSSSSQVFCLKPPEIN